MSQDKGQKITDKETKEQVKYLKFEHKGKSHLFVNII